MEGLWGFPKYVTPYIIRMIFLPRSAEHAVKKKPILLANLTHQTFTMYKACFIVLIDLCDWVGGR